MYTRVAFILTAKVLRIALKFSYVLKTYRWWGAQPDYPTGNLMYAFRVVQHMLLCPPPWGVIK